MNLSQLVALYCLAAFYVETHDWGAAARPLTKFMVIKAIVFVSWWQGLGIAGAHNLGLLPPQLGYSSEEVSHGLQNFAICIEMFFYMIGFHYAFSYTDFWPAARGVVPPMSLLAAADAALDAEDAAGAGTPRVVAGGGGAGAPGPPREGGGASPPPDAPETPLGYGAAVRGLLPFDVLADTGESLRTGFGLTHKWEKRAKARRAELHAAGDAAWAAAGLPQEAPRAAGAGAGAAGAGADGDDAAARAAAPRPVPLLKAPRLAVSVASQRTRPSRMASGAGGGGPGGGPGGATPRSDDSSPPFSASDDAAPHV
jgi:hypothetical protein